MKQPISRASFSIAVLAFVGAILAMTLIPQAVAASASGSKARITDDFLNREYSYTYYLRQTANSHTISSSNGVLVSIDDGLLVFAVETNNGSTHYKAIPVDGLVSMHTIDDTP